MRHLGIIAALVVVGCGAPRGQGPEPGWASSLLPDVRLAKGRPPVVVVARAGDPAGALAVAVMTSAGPNDESHGAEPAVALAGVLESRLRRQALEPTVTPQWDGFRAVVLTSTAANAATTAKRVREALLSPIDATDLAAANTKLAALGARPLPDPALERWARCVSAPYARVATKTERTTVLTIPSLEALRREHLGLGRVAFGVTGQRAIGDAVASTIASGPAWPSAAPLDAPEPRELAKIDAETYTTPREAPAGPIVVHGTIDLPTSTDAVATAAALGDPRGPLSARLGALALPFHLKEITGAAHAVGGCVGFVLESVPGVQPTDLAARVADAVAIVHVEAHVDMSGGMPKRDGRTLARRAGDPRASAERAAWWALVDPREHEARSARHAQDAMRGSVAVGAPSFGSASPKEQAPPPALSRDALARALARAKASWKAPVVERRTRLERGQGEAWVLVASSCGTRTETEVDAGLTALFVTATAELVKGSPDVTVEPWVAPDGAGLIAHGAARPGESPEAHARRLSDVVTEAFAVTKVTPEAMLRARAVLAARSASLGSAWPVLARALAPAHPSALMPTGTTETSTRAPDAAIVARAEALRAGPLRVAVLANVDDAQGDAAVRAADRWVDRDADAARTCPAQTTTPPPESGTIATSTRPGELPSVLIAFPFAPGDARASSGAELVAAALDGPDGLLAQITDAASARVFARSTSPALVIRLARSDAELDETVAKTLALLARLHTDAATTTNAFAHAASRADRRALDRALDPRARLVATWRGEPAIHAEVHGAGPTASPADARDFARRYLAQATMIVVAARPPEAPP